MLENKRRKLYTKEDALVNKFDDDETNISDLPPEMFKHIFKFLSDDDIDNCLEVNLQWRNNANDTLYWRARCEKYGAEDEGSETELAGGKFENLCRPARIWFAFRNSPAYRWRNNSPREHNPDHHSSRYQLHGKGLKFLSNRLNYMEYLVKFSQPETIHKLFPDVEISPHLGINLESIFMGKKFALFYYKKVLLVFKFEYHTLNFDFAIGLKNEEPYVIKGFDDQRFSNSESVKERHINDLIVYLENRLLFQLVTNDGDWIQYWIDFRSHLISPMVYIGGCVIKFTEDHMIVMKKTRKSSFTVYDLEGSNPRIIPGKFLYYKANNNVFFGSKYNNTMESWDMKTGKLLQSFTEIEVLDENYVAIHPNLEFGYVKQNGIEIQAINLRTGQIIWESGGIDIGCLIKVVCGKYLVEHSADDGESHHINVWYLKDGRLLYQRKFLKSSIHNTYISEDYISNRYLQKCECSILSYLP